MKAIGIIGGLGWPSTVDYYRLLCVKASNSERDRGAARPYPTPHLLIEPLNMARAREFRGTEGDRESWRSYESVFRESFERLRRSGAELGIIASNTATSDLTASEEGFNCLS
jgi:aspartate racemase